MSALDEVCRIEDLDRPEPDLFYLADLLKSALLACVERHRKDLADRLETEAKSFAGELSQSVLGGISAQIGDCITDISWTGVDATLFAANIVSTQIPELAGVMILGRPLRVLSASG